MRSSFRRAAGSGAGAFLLGGGGSLAYELLEAGPAEAATPEPGVHNFRTRPDLRPPIVEVVHPAQETADGYLFITPLSGPGQRGVQMLDDRGNVVWFRPVLRQAALNFRAATYKGEPVLTWWEGKAVQGLGAGHCVIVDQSYRQIARVQGRRPARRPARVPDHAARHGARHEQRGPHDGPHRASAGRRAGPWSAA